MSATSSPSVSRALASSARKSWRREADVVLQDARPVHFARDAICPAVIAGSVSDHAIQTSFSAFLDCLAALVMTVLFGDLLRKSHESLFLPRLAVRPQGSHRGNRTRPDRSTRVLLRRGRAGTSQ